jgi:hypothetical protein
MRKSSYHTSSIPLVQAANYGGRQRPTAVLLMTSWTTGDKGAANGIAQSWHNPNNRVESSHYVIDEAQTIRCVPDKIEALNNERSYKGAISINVCHDPPFGPLPEVMCRTAQLTARLCRIYRIPVRVLSRSEEERWMRHKWRSRGGILLKTVGYFPTDEFFASVENKYKGF